MELIRFVFHTTFADALCDWRQDLEGGEEMSNEEGISKYLGIPFDLLSEEEGHWDCSYATKWAQATSDEFDLYRRLHTMVADMKKAMPGHLLQSGSSWDNYLFLELKEDKSL